MSDLEQIRSENLLYPDGSDWKLLGRTVSHSEVPDETSGTNVAPTMQSPYGLRIVESSLACLTRKGGVFCDLSASALKALDEFTAPVNYPKGAVLFMEGQRARGIFVVCSGQVKLSISSRDGKVIIVKIAQAGELMGLHATLSGNLYELTAEVSKQAQVNFVPRSAFARFLQMNSEAFMRIAKLLMDSHYEDHELIRSLGFRVLLPKDWPDYC